MSALVGDSGNAGRFVDRDDSLVTSQDLDVWRGVGWLPVDVNDHAGNELLSGVAKALTVNEDATIA